MIKRKDLGTRIGAEKAQLPDELLTRSQIIPGENISFTYLDNYDIQINALLSQTLKNKGLKFFHCSIPLIEFTADRFKSIEDGGNKFAGLGWYDIYHNFNLSSDIHKYSAWINDLRLGFGTSGISPLPLIKLTSINKNTVRLYAAISKSFVYNYPGLPISNHVNNDGDPSHRSNEDDFIKVTLIAE